MHLGDPGSLADKRRGIVSSKMANEEQLALIRQGPPTWNQWRQTNALTLLDLSEAKLSEARLRGANLSKVDLSEADLSEADLGEAELGRADLSWADLREADLRGVNLRQANLRQANLSKAKLSGAHFAETLFINMKLVDVVGLEACSHHGPSTMDYRTLAQRQLPVPFLRGCGLPDKLIDYLSSLLLPQAIQFYSCFISYSTKDEEDWAMVRHCNYLLAGITVVALTIPLAGQEDPSEDHRRS